MINLENIHSPCEMCFLKGYSFSMENKKCQCCEYNIAIQMLRQILKGNEDYVGVIANDYIINWEKLFDKLII